MSGRRKDGDQPLDRLVRVRRVRARQAAAALGRVQARQLSEAGLLSRVRTLLAQGGVRAGEVRAAELKARLASDEMLARLAADVSRRLGGTDEERARLGAALGRARAAVDAAVERRAERESGDEGSSGR
ncbi:MAG: hypothetical protein ACMVO5_04915 [Polymorphobacter sp.]|uniref:hypothetical protein n=1 Tax=Polymorphobacter sp. TaxID=1909290 RepID=UPI003A85AEEC